MELFKVLWLWAGIYKMDTTFMQYPECKSTDKWMYLGPFLLNRETRQGCLLSPLLFALAVEPLAETIYICTDIVGFRRYTGKEKIALYADDALVFMGDTHTYLSTVISLIDTYWIFSVFYINLLLIGTNR